MNPWKVGVICVAVVVSVISFLVLLDVGLAVYETLLECRVLVDSLIDR